MRLAPRTTLLSLAIALALPATASAATTIGSSMPAFTGDALACDDPGGCTFVPTSISGTPVVVPHDGVLVRFNTQTPPGASPVTPILLRPAAGGAFTPVDRSGPGDYRVKAGDLIGVSLDDGEEIGIAAHAGFDSTSLTFIPRLRTGDTRVPTQTESDDFEILLNAVIEPDADADGYGDETQDFCPQSRETHMFCGKGMLLMDPGPPAVQAMPRVGSVLAGGQTTVKIGVRAPRLHAWPNAVMTLKVPPELAGLAASGPAPCSVATDRIVCPLGDLPASTTVMLSATLRGVRPGGVRLAQGGLFAALLEANVTTNPSLPLTEGRATLRVLATGACANPVTTAWLANPATAAGDHIVGRRGVDRLNGLAGDDCLLGGASNDVLGGGEGNDRVEGETGYDLLRGEAGNDYLIGGPGNDRLEGGEGKDRLEAVDKAPDTVRCGPGRDRARVDRGDSVAGCESVERVGPAKKRRPRRKR